MLLSLFLSFVQDTDSSIKCRRQPSAIQLTSSRCKKKRKSVNEKRDRESFSFQIFSVHTDRTIDSERSLGRIFFSFSYSPSFIFSLSLKWTIKCGRNNTSSTKMRPARENDKQKQSILLSVGGRAGGREMIMKGNNTSTPFFLSPHYFLFFSFFFFFFFFLPLLPRFNLYLPRSCSKPRHELKFFTKESSIKREGEDNE